MRALYSSLLLFPLVLVAAFAQGLTTGSLSGTVRDAQSKQALVGATVVATQLSSGTKYGAITRKNGSYSIRGMRIGSGYKVTVSFVGYTQEVRENVSISLGDNPEIHFLMRLSQASTKEIVVTAQTDPVFHQANTGSSSTVTEAEIQAAPTINRSISDVARINPYASQTTGYGGDDGLQGISIGGINSRYNSVQIDGAIANDMFGLGQAGTAGSQANANTLSMEAIQELQVNISPYDVRLSGFTGGLINAVTRSGSNKPTGSIFAYGRNEFLVGPSPDASRSAYPNFKDFQTGGRIGGAIVRDQLFFHVTGEVRLRTKPLDLALNDPSKINNFPHAQSEIDQIATIAKNSFGYDAGSSDPFVSRNNTYNILARLDWNVDDKNKIQFRHNYTNAFQDRNVTRSSTVFSLSSQWNEFRSINNSSVLQWNSQVGESMANEMRLTFTNTSDERVLRASVSPQVKVWLTSTDYVLFGPERSSGANSLDQTQLALTDDFSFVLGDHVISVGTHTEWYRFNNLFIQDYYGTYVFRDVNALRDSTPSSYTLTYANTDATGGDLQPRALWSMMQSGLYVQDEWKLSPDFALKLGVRGDVPIYLDLPTENPTFSKTFDSLANRYASLSPDQQKVNTPVPSKLHTSALPNAAILWSPRVGFNWDPTGEKQLQIRGGTGLFSGKVAAVWLSNQFSNTGVEFSHISVGSDAASAAVLLGLDKKTPLKVSLDPFNPPKPGDGSFAGANDKTTAINIVSKDFLPPQVWRSTLASDIRLAPEISMTAELMYSLTLNNVDYANLNLRRSLRLSNSPLDGRPLYAANASRTSVDSNASPSYTQVLYLSSRDEGYQYSAMAAVRVGDRNRILPGFSATLGYVYSAAYDLQATTAATALSNWQNTYVTDPNHAEVARSNFDIPHRFVANLSYSFYLFPKTKTTFNVLYSASSGQPYSFVYNGGDYNGDGVGFNDLIYIPKADDYNTKVTIVPAGGIDLRTAPQIWSQLMNFIDANSTLKQYQGSVLPRNAMRAPFVHQLDLRLTQQIPYIDGERLQISLDCQNFLNLLNSSWGLQQYVNFQSYSLFELKPDNNSNVFDSRGRLMMNFSTPTVNGRPGVYLTDSFYSRWRMQLGIRYSF